MKVNLKPIFCKPLISPRHLEIVKSGFFMLFYQQIVQIWESKYQLSKVTKPIKFNHCTFNQGFKVKLPVHKPR